MKVRSSRFGELEVQEADLIQFPEGVLGFETVNKFFIVDPADETLVLWLQAVDKPDVAFPILEPRLFKSDYKVRLSGSELRALKLDAQTKKEALVYCILTIPGDITKLTANLKAPVVINAQSQIGRQVVLQENDYNVKTAIYRELVAMVLSVGKERASAGAASTDAAALDLRSAPAKLEVSAL